MWNFLTPVLLLALLGPSSASVLQGRNDVSNVWGVKEIKWEEIQWDNLPYGNKIPNNITTALEMEEIAKELQRQIDQLRKQINDIIKKSESTEDEETAAKLKKQMEDLQVQVQDLYKKIDELSSELQQEFRQKLDALAKEMAEAHKKLEDRVKDLEDLVQKMAISQCIGNLRDGMVETALGTFRHIKNPNLHIEQIISDAYQGVSSCIHSNSFLHKIESETELTTKRKNEIRARGYFSLYNHLSKDQFTPEGSDCTYPLAWNVKEIQNRLKTEEIISKDYTSRVLTKLPKSISQFTVDKLVKIYILSFNKESGIQSCYYNEIGARLIITDQYWNTTQTVDGTWFMLFNQDERPLFNLRNGDFAQITVLSKNNYQNMLNDPSALWKPTAISNSQVYLENKRGLITGSYLGRVVLGEGNCECNLFGLGNFHEKTNYNVQ